MSAATTPALLLALIAGGCGADRPQPRSAAAPVTTAPSTPAPLTPTPVASARTSVGLERLHLADAAFDVLVDGATIALVASSEHRITLVAPTARVLLDGLRSGAPFDDPDFGISAPWLEGDQVAFRMESGQLTDGSSQPPPHRCGVYLTGPTGTHEIASWRTSVPDHRATFSCVGAPVIRGGTVYFTGAVGNDWVGLYAWSSGRLRTVVSTRTSLPDGRRFIGAFSYLSGQRDRLRVSYELDSGDRGVLEIDERDTFRFLSRGKGGAWPPHDFYDTSLVGAHGPVGFGPVARGDHVAFLGAADDPASDLRACAIAIHDGKRTRLACRGDTVDGVQILGLFLSMRPLDGPDVVFTAQLSDGRYGAYRAHLCSTADDPRCRVTSVGSPPAIAR